MPLQLIFWMHYIYSHDINSDLNERNREVGAEVSLVLIQIRKETMQLGHLCFLSLSFLTVFSTMEPMIMVQAVLFGR